MTETDLSAHTSRPHRFAGLGFNGSIATVSWMAGAFVICLVLAAVVLARFGAGEGGTILALRVTARWCFLLFWPAYAGGAIAKLGGPCFASLARRGREFGLAFASALLVHVALVLWFLRISSSPSGAMLFFWAGVLCAFLLTLFSWPRLRELLGARLWRLFCTLALEYIALVFAADFILDPLEAGGLDKYPPTYLPFVAMLVGGFALRVAAWARPLVVNKQ